MKFFLGILVILFIALTMGFADLAYANRCGAFLDAPEYIGYYEESYGHRENGPFNHERSGYYLENQRGERYEEFYEYESRPQDEFSYNDMF